MTTNTCKHLVAYFNANTNAKQTLIIDKEKFSGLKADSVRRYCLELTKNGEATKNEDGTYTLTDMGRNAIQTIINDSKFFHVEPEVKTTKKNTNKTSGEFKLQNYTKRILDVIANAEGGVTDKDLMNLGYAKGTITYQIYRIRKAGNKIETFKRDGSTCYRIIAA